MTYTVTTPASYVFFQQTVRPGSGEAASGAGAAAVTSHNHANPNLKRQKFKQILERETQAQERDSAVADDRPQPNLRLAIEANDDHYYPNRDPYFPGPGHGAGGSYRPPGAFSPLPPIVPPPGISYSPAPAPVTPDSYQPPGINYSPAPVTPAPHHPPMTATYQPPVATYHPPSVPVYHAPSSLPDTSYHTQSRPAYRPFDPPTTISFNPTVVQSDLFFQPVKKRPPRRHHKKFPSHHSNSVAPGTKFHFVEDFSSPAAPGPHKVKRFPAETASSLDVGPRPGRGGVVALLKAEDLTVMAALLEETHLDRSIDKQGQSINTTLGLPSM